MPFSPYPVENSKTLQYSSLVFGKASAFRLFLGFVSLSEKVVSGLTNTQNFTESQRQEHYAIPFVYLLSQLHSNQTLQALWHS